MAEFKYNHDLILEDEDMKRARDAFPAIHPALDHEELKTLFNSHDIPANDMKAASMHWGVFAVLLIALALVGASTAHFFEHSAWAGPIGLLSALAGIAGALIGALGVMYAARKNRWLEHRFVTERLRQFHFQSLVALAPEILAAAKSGDWTEFRSARAAQFSTFEQTIQNELRATFDLTLEDNEDAAKAAHVWVVRSTGAKLPADATHWEEFKRAYRVYRIAGQRAFAQDKLGLTGRWLARPVRQLRLLQFLLLAAMGLLVLLHLAVAFGIWLHVPEPLLTVTHVAAIWLAIGALAIRTLDEGLQPAPEIQRYRAYRDGARNILRRYDAAKSASATLALMREMEELSFDEMASFLKSNQDAVFRM